MGIINNSLIDNNLNKLVIPCTGDFRLIDHMIAGKLMCSTIDKGYIQTEDMDIMFDLLNYISAYDSIKLVGSTDKVKLSNSNIAVYRQRIYFNDLELILGIIRLVGIQLVIPNDFYITMNNILPFPETLKYLYYYAKEKNLSIDKFLADTCLVHLTDCIEEVGVINYSLPDLSRVYNSNLGLLDRAPFLLLKYDKNNPSKYRIFHLKEYRDNRKFSWFINRRNIFAKCGFSDTSIAKDTIKGRFRRNNL